MRTRERTHRDRDIGFGEALRDVLRAVPVERLQMQHEGAFDFRLIAGQRQLRCQRRVRGEIPHLHVCQDLQSRAVRVINHDQGDAIIGGHVAEADILQIAAKIRERQRLVVEDFDEARRPAAVLHIRPAALGDRSHVEAVARFDERHLVLGETVEGPVAFEILPHLAGAIGRLRRLHARRGDNVEEFVGHSNRPPVNFVSKLIRRAR